MSATFVQIVYILVYRFTINLEINIKISQQTFGIY